MRCALLDAEIFIRREIDAVHSRNGPLVNGPVAAPKCATQFFGVSEFPEAMPYRNVRSVVSIAFSTVGGVRDERSGPVTYASCAKCQIGVVFSDSDDKHSIGDLQHIGGG